MPEELVTQDVNVPSPPTDQPAAPVEAQATGETVDIAQIKSMLDLPETASDIELITVLVNLVAHLQEKYEGLLADAAALEDNLINRDIAAYQDVIEENAEPFWREQLIENRSSAIEALESIRARMPVPPGEPEPQTQPDRRAIPMRNRLAAIERSVETITSGEDPVADRVASKIRNRAHELTRNEGIPFIIAFDRATREFNAIGA